MASASELIGKMSAIKTPVKVGGSLERNGKTRAHSNPAKNEDKCMDTPGWTYIMLGWEVLVFLLGRYSLTKNLRRRTRRRTQRCQ